MAPFAKALSSPGPCLQGKARCPTVLFSGVRLSSIEGDEKIGSEMALRFEARSPHGHVIRFLCTKQASTGTVLPDGRIKRGRSLGRAQEEALTAGKG